MLDWVILNRNKRIVWGRVSAGGVLMDTYATKREAIRDMSIGDRLVKLRIEMMERVGRY